MKTLAYCFLIVWYHYLADISWKDVMRIVVLPLIFIAKGLGFAVSSIFIAILFVLLAIYGGLALIVGLFMWSFEKIFPDSPLFNQRKMPESFHQELIKLSFQA